MTELKNEFSWSKTRDEVFKTCSQQFTGSFNFTKAAEEKNAENLLVIRDRKLAERYTRNWQEHHLHSEVYVGRGGNRFAENRERTEGVLWEK